MRLACALALVVLARGAAYAQQTIRTYSGHDVGALFGWSLALVGDVDDDGRDDLAVGAPLADPNGVDSGSLSVFSGRNGFLLHIFNGEFMNQNFGASVSGAGDLDGDGFADVLVGAPGSLARYADPATSTGSAYVFSGRTGETLRVFSGEQPGDRFGLSVAGAGDLNDDGTPDLAIGAPGTRQGEVVLSDGRVYVLSGSDGSELLRLQNRLPNGAFGASLAAMGDMNADGTPDLLIGEPDTLNGGLVLEEVGHVYLASGADGATIRDFPGVTYYEYYGWSIANGGDIDGDGLNDPIIGAPVAGNGGFASGAVRVRSGATGALIYNFNGESAFDAFGIKVAGGGDFNRDGVPDIAGGAYACSDIVCSAVLGYARIFSGANGSILFALGQSRGLLPGYVVAPAGDVDADGHEDVTVGAPEDLNGLGAARVFSSDPCLDADGDGYSSGPCGPLDCDDANPAIHPNGPEIPGNAVDENCNGNFLCATAAGEDSAARWLFVLAAPAALAAGRIIARRR